MNPAVRVILTSGSQVGFGRVFEEDGAVAFLQKPYDVQMLREVLGRFGVRGVTGGQGEGARTSLSARGP